MDIKIDSWAKFKATCITQKNLNLQFSDEGDSYFIIGPDSAGINWVIVLPKKISDPKDPQGIAQIDNPDAVDFVNKVLPSCNFAIGVRAYPFSTPDMQFAGSGFVAVFNRAVTDPVQSDFLFQLNDGFYLNGGEYWTIGSVAGDTLQVDVVDHDNVLGFGVDTVLISPSYLTSWNILSSNNVKNLFQVVYAAKPPSGVYLRFRYTANGTDADVNFYCNLFLHKGI